MFIDGVPVSFSYEGDMEEVVKWIPLAQKLYRQARALNVPSLLRTPTDEVLIRVENVMPSLGKIYIRAEGCKPIPPHLVWRGSDIAISLESLFEKPTTYGNPVGMFKDGTNEVYKIAQTVAGQTLTTDTSQKAKLKKAELPATEYLDRTPSKYSGHMRWLVQQLWDHGITFTKAISKTIPFSYHWRLTHGLTRYKARELKDGTPVYGWWLVELSKEGAFALHLGELPADDACAVRRLIQSKLKSHFYDLSVKPPSYATGTQTASCVQLFRSYQDTLKRAKIIQLISGNVMSQACDRDPWSQLHGWAFSSTGHECQIVVSSQLDGADVLEQFGISAPHPNKLYGYMMARYKVAIEAKLDRQGIPTISAALSKEEGDDLSTLWCGGDRNSIGWFGAMGREPFYTEIVHSKQYDGNGTDCPIHVFYEGSAPNIIRWSNVTTTYSGGYTYSTTPSNSAAPYYTGSTMIGSSYYEYPAGSTTAVKGFASPLANKSPGSSPTSPASGEDHTYVSSMGFSGVPTGDSLGTDHCGPDSNWSTIYPSLYSVTRYISGSGDNAGVVYEDALVMVYSDRELVYFGEKGGVRGYGGSYTTQCGKHDGGGTCGSNPVRFYPNFQEHADKSFGSPGRAVKCTSVDYGNATPVGFISYVALGTSSYPPNQSRSYSGHYRSGSGISVEVPIEADAPSPDPSAPHPNSIGGELIGLTMEDAEWTSNQAAKIHIYIDPDNNGETDITLPFYGFVSAESEYMLEISMQMNTGRYDASPNYNLVKVPHAFVRSA